MLRRAAGPLLVCILGLSVGAGRAKAEQPDLNSLEATRARPLFSPTRRAPPPVDAGSMAAPVAAPVPPPRLQLSGIILGPDKRVAVVTRLEDSKILSLEVGNQVEGWTVAMVGPRGITLKRDDRLVSVELRSPGR